MLVRDVRDGVLVIGQASHAWLSGQLARAWGNAGFDRPHPFEAVCLAAEQHDVGMAEWDLAPPLQARTGRPQSFMEMSLADHLELWSRAPSRLLTQSRHAALLVSMHGSALYERRDLSRMSRADAAAVREYLERERRWQAEQLDALEVDPASARRAQQLLWAWDGLSLAVCLGWRPYALDDVPARGQGTEAMRLEPVESGSTAGGADADEAGRCGAPERFRLEPWPFGADRVPLTCEGRRLSGEAHTASELHAELARARPLPLSFELTRA